MTYHPMKTPLIILAAGLLAGSLVPIIPATAVAAAAAVPSSPPVSADHPRVEVCFVLDTTGSMGGLIEGAKQKIWSIANEIAAAKPTPDVRVGLVAFRDRGDEYVVRSWPLTDDLDAIYGHLRELVAAGGGDFPESVNEALAEGVSPKLKCSDSPDVLRLVFLVGDAPPHMDYRDGPKYPDVCREAVKRGLIINTVQCGADATTTRVWEEIARLSEGRFAAIPPDGGVAVVEAPQDKRLSELNRDLGKTLVPYGSAGLRREVMAKQAAAESAPAPAAADRLLYNSRSAKSVQGAGELLDDLRAGKQKLADVKKDQLPADLQDLDAEALHKELDRRGAERAKLQAEVGRLSREREEFLRAETQCRAEGKGAGKQGDGFDDKVRAIHEEFDRVRAALLAEVA